MRQFIKELEAKAILTVNLYKRDGELFLRGIEAAGVNLHGEKMNKR